MLGKLPMLGLGPPVRGGNCTAPTSKGSVGLTGEGAAGVWGRVTREDISLSLHPSFAKTFWSIFCPPFSWNFFGVGEMTPISSTSQATIPRPLHRTEGPPYYVLSSGLSCRLPLLHIKPQMPYHSDFIVSLALDSTSSLSTLYLWFFSATLTYSSLDSFCPHAQAKGQKYFLEILIKITFNYRVH